MKRFAIILVLCSLAHATTYYVSIGSGSDSAAGTAKGTAWAHAPGMQTFTGSYTCAAGDQIILKGGETWPNASFMWQIPTCGTSGSPVYVGVDKTWFTGGSWTRPILNAGGTLISNNTNGMCRYNEIGTSGSIAANQDRYSWLPIPEWKCGAVG